MEFEQIVKRLEWLDDEHRKDKTAITALEEKIALLDNNISTLSKQIKTLGKQIGEVTPSTARIDQFEEMVARVRADMNQALDNLEKKYQRREHEALKRHQAALEEISSSLPKLDQSKEIVELRRMIKERGNEDIKLNIAITEIKPKIDEAIRLSKDVAQSVKLVEDSRRQDIKRVADLQGEITAVRKRTDEFRQKTDLQADSLRNIENRFSELIASEASRKQTHQEFLDKQTLALVERDRIFKEWQAKYDAFKLETETLDAQTQALDETLRGAKRAQEAFMELNQKLERRINEVTEMQRLAEDRLRQEWVTFKADDQKRWTGYNLSSEESVRDLQKAIDKLETRVTSIDDAAQNLQDLLHQTTDATEQQLQELMNVAHQWLTSYERIMGHVRKTQK